MMIIKSETINSGQVTEITVTFEENSNYQFDKCQMIFSVLLAIFLLCVILLCVIFILLSL